MFDQKNYQKQWRKQHPNYQRNWRKNNPEKVKKLTQKQKYRYHHDAEYHKKALMWGSNNTRKINAGLQRQVSKIIQCSKCEHCGFSDVRALEIHHVNGNQTRKSYYKTMKDIIEGRIEFKVLCANCHRIFHRLRKFEW